MKPPEPAALEAAIRRACAERDWERLTALDQLLAELLRTQPQSLDAAARAALRAAYRDALEVCRADSAELQEKIAALSHQREAQIAYAEVSDWNQA